MLYGDPNKPMFDNLLDSTYKKKPFGSFGNNIHTEIRPLEIKVLETFRPISPPMALPPVRINPISPLPMGAQIMRQVNPFMH